MPGKSRKGQFFIMGALLLCVLFFAGLPSQTQFSRSDTMDITTLLDNLESEITVALNLAMLEDGNPSKLGDFSDFLRDKTQERYMDMETLWVVTSPDPNSPGDIDIYAGNWLGESATLYLTIGTNNLNMNLNDQETNYASLSGISDQFDIQISFGERAWSSTLPRDKTNLYSFMSLSRGEDSVIKEIVG
jgi:hypothetical protein